VFSYFHVRDEANKYDDDDDDDDDCGRLSYGSW
jgi:hypothetical protein